MYNNVKQRGHLGLQPRPLALLPAVLGRGLAAAPTPAPGAAAARLGAVAPPGIVRLENIFVNFFEILFDLLHPLQPPSTLQSSSSQGCTSTRLVGHLLPQLAASLTT